jgi:hypothetical protein
LGILGRGGLMAFMVGLSLGFFLELSGTDHCRATACGSLPVTEDDEPSGDLYIKYASEPTPSECQDIRLEMRFEAGTGFINWKKSQECTIYNHGIC